VDYFTDLEFDRLGIGEPAVTTDEQPA
jgi:hypothetical protein